MAAPLPLDLQDESLDMEYIKLRNLQPFITSDKDFIGEGSSAKVYAIHIIRYPKLCLKVFKWTAKEEPFNMFHSHVQISTADSHDKARVIESVKC